MPSSMFSVSTLPINIPSKFQQVATGNTLLLCLLLHAFAPAILRAVTYALSFLQVPEA